jgi:hypothetical protein
MAFSKSFERKLNDLFGQRTDWLRRKLGTAGAGKPPVFRRKKVDDGIRDLQAIASDALARKLAKSEFEKHVATRRNYHIKGHGPDDKRARFATWFSANFPRGKGFVYAFWGNRRRCIYVGRTGSHGSRPSSHFEKYWFSGVKRVTIFAVEGERHIPKLECLAIHHFQPSRNRNKAATKKWTTACPLCLAHRHIEVELRDIFRFRSRRRSRSRS